METTHAEFHLDEVWYNRRQWIDLQVIVELLFCLTGLLNMAMV
jgi:hypothetical protein